MIPVFEKNLNEGDVLILTADHGMQHRADYGYHNKEPLPLIVEKIGCPPPLAKDCGFLMIPRMAGCDLKLSGIKTGKEKTLAEIGYMAARAFGCEEEYSRKCGRQALF